MYCQTRLNCEYDKGYALDGEAGFAVRDLRIDAPGVFCGVLAGYLAAARQGGGVVLDVEMCIRDRPRSVPIISM